MGRVKRGSIQITKAIYGLEQADPAVLARIRRERYERHFDISADQVTGMAKWLVASLFAANSGGVLTVLNTSEKLANPQAPGIIFVFGLLFALVSAAALQEVYDRLSDPLADMIDFWSKVESGAVHDEDKHEEISQRLKRVTKWAVLPPILGWFSGVTFLTGAILIAFGFKG